MCVYVCCVCVNSRVRMRILEPLIPAALDQGTQDKVNNSVQRKRSETVAIT